MYRNEILVSKRLKTRRFGDKMKIIIISLFLTISSISRAEHTFLYKKISESLKTLNIEDGEIIGEESFSKKEKDKRDLLQERITSLLSWTYSPVSKEDIILSSGVFAMIAPKKTKLTDSFEKEVYSELFSSDSYGSSFLYKDYIITNYHMCRGLNTIIRDYTNKLYSVKVLIYDIKQDICILKAPEGVKNQRNFASFKMPLNNRLEEERKLRYDIKISNLKNKKYLSNLDKQNIIILENEKKSDNRDYAYISGAYGEFYIYKISNDTTKDIFSKKNGFTAYGEKCKSGVSGSPVISKNGLIGLFWGAETEPSKNERLSEKRYISSLKNQQIEKNPLCYFVDKSEIDLLISKYEKLKK